MAPLKAKESSMVQPVVHMEQLKVLLKCMKDLRGPFCEHVMLSLVDIASKTRLLHKYGPIELIASVPVAMWHYEEQLLRQWRRLQRLQKSRSFKLGPNREQKRQQLKDIIADFGTRLQKVLDEYESKGPQMESHSLDNAVETYTKFVNECAELEVLRGENMEMEQLLDLQVTVFPGLYLLRQNLNQLKPMIDFHVETKAVRLTWSLLLWHDLDITKIVDSNQDYFDRLKTFSKEIRQTNLARLLTNTTKHFQDSLSLIKLLKDPALRPRHWSILMDRTGIKFDMDPSTFTLQHIFNMNLRYYTEIINQIFTEAQREVAIEKYMEELRSVWTEVKFTFTLNTRMRAGAVHTISELDKQFSLVEEQMLNLQSIANSRISSAFSTPVHQWEKDLSKISETLEILASTQQKWVYLEALFMAGDIGKQLPSEATQFKKLDNTFRMVLKQAYDNKYINKWCLGSNRKAQLNAILEGLDGCQKALNDYLERKRVDFPRFYFISDDELLSILGAKDFESMHENIIKMFDNIAALPTIVKNEKDEYIQSMRSYEGEELSFLEEAIFTCCLDKKRVDWILDYQGMIGLTAGQIWFTWECEDTFKKLQNGNRYAMKEFSRKMMNQLEEIVVKVRTHLVPLHILRLETALILDVHSKDIIERFVRDNVCTKEDFAWESQLRFYWLRTLDDLRIRQISSEFPYSYEYMGMNGRLVITPLTDRIYLTLTQALSLALGGAPAGPAGTGKTETVKDLAKAMGLFCVVTNCGEHIDFRSFAKLLSGLARSGSWGCFDEFNRIESSVLSVVSTQIRAIQNAIRYNMPQFKLDGEICTLDPRVGIFITMNPGYAGRTQLPESLKALFRPVVVVVPDLDYICEIVLFSQGFLGARELARKVTSVYRLAKEQLSPQFHYDFGLRALKSVLLMAGEMWRLEPEKNEYQLILSALRDSNIPRFVDDDVPLFYGLIQDLFPAHEMTNADTSREMRNAIIKTLSSKGLTTVEKELMKVVQLRDTMKWRHSVMLIGPTCTGKTTVLAVLCRALKQLHKVLKLYTINPKDRDLKYLYGYLDPSSREWQDGLLSSLFRLINAHTESSDHKAIVLDGDVDALWIENMNSVMDDNRILTLINGERIKLLRTSHLLFEVSGLPFASPATVSRCGMVYVDRDCVGVQNYVTSWIVFPLVEFVFHGADLQVLSSQVPEDPTSMPMRGRIHTVVELEPMNVVMQLCRLLELLLSVNGSADEPIPTELRERLFSKYSRASWSKMDSPYEAPDYGPQMIFIMCTSICFTNIVVPSSQAKVDGAIKMLSELSNVDEKDAGQLPPGCLPVGLPMLTDYLYSQEFSNWIPWAELVPEFVYNDFLRFNDNLVPIPETVRIKWMLGLCNRAQFPLLLVGETGSCKTAAVNAFIYERSDRYHPIFMHFCARTKSRDVQHVVMANVEKRAKGLYGAPSGKLLNVIIDDINMPRQSIEFMRMLVSKRGFYEIGKSSAWSSITSPNIVATMEPPGGGREILDPRFVSLFTVFATHPPCYDSLLHIYKQLLRGSIDSSFSEELTNSVPAIVEMSVKLYFRIRKEILPTPTKFHYIFNMRDVTRLIQGLTLATREKFVKVSKFIRLWRHEALRVFWDRLNESQDCNMVNEFITEHIQAYFPDAHAASQVEPILFGDFWNGLDEEMRVYEDLVSYENVRALVDEILAAYKREVNHLDLVLFDDALKHILVANRALRFDRGHVFLIGVSGTGKQVVANLAAFCARMVPFEISLTPSYGEMDFREDLKFIYTKLANTESNYMFVFTDNHCRNEAFLQLVNSILTLGFITSLFNDEEKDQLLKSISMRAERNLRLQHGANALITRETIWKWFQNNCAARLHVVLCMSPVGTSLRDRCRSYPGLVKATTIDWFFLWPEQALYTVACAYLNPQCPLITPALWPVLIINIVSIHQSVQKMAIDFSNRLRRILYITPRNYLAFIKDILRILNEEIDTNTKLRKRFQTGLEKLRETEEQMSEINKTLKVQEGILSEKADRCKVMLEEINEQTRWSTNKRAEVEQQTEDIEKQAEELKREKAEAEGILADVIPVLEQSRRALDDLNKSDVTEIRAFAMPPKAVQVVGESLCYLFQTSDISWRQARSLMSDANFLSSLRNLDVESIPNKCINALKEMLDRRNVQAEEIRAASRAGGGIFKFVNSAISFHKVAKEVKPKRERVRLLERDYTKALRDLSNAKEELENLTIKLNQFRKKFTTAQNEMKALNQQKIHMEKRLMAANKLTVGLRSEKTRWVRQLEELTLNRKNLVGHGLLSAAFLHYLGPLTSEYRKLLLYHWWTDRLWYYKIPFAKNFRIENVLATELEVAIWKAHGLPNDEHSIQNAILTLKSSRTPICIDPQGQALSWMKQLSTDVKDSSKAIRVVTQKNSSYLQALENCLRLGLPIMFESLEDYIEPSLRNVVFKNIRKDSEGVSYVALGDHEVVYNPDFRIYMMSKLSNPKFNPSIYGNTTVINYALTMGGLEEQLLGVLVKHEKRELEERRERLIHEMNESQKTLKEVEDRLLLELSLQTGDMLENWELIATLDTSKTKGIDMMKQLSKAKRLRKDVEKQRNGYCPAAKRGAILYFVIENLSLINTMYQCSLGAYLNVFVKALKNATVSKKLEQRLTFIMNTLTAMVFSYASLGIFEEHKLLLSFSIALQLQLQDNRVTLDKLSFFVRGNVLIAQDEARSQLPWLPDAKWREVVCLSVSFPEVFGSLLPDLLANKEKWSEWYQSEQPELGPYPGRLGNISGFDLLCLIRAFRSDRVTAAVRNYVNSVLGETFVDQESSSLMDVLQATDPTVPILFVVSAGADPAVVLHNLAAKTSFPLDRINSLAVGQGQEVTAEKMVNQGLSRGNWVLLENCHLVPKLVIKIDSILLECKKPHTDFRLWITSEQADNFPVAVLIRSYRIVLESPTHLKHNLICNLDKLSPEQFVASEHPKFRSCLFVLCFLHAILSERKRYGKIGWNVSYDFSDSDLAVSLRIIQISLDKALNSEKDISWDTLKYLIGEVMYGGRTIDEYDRRVLITYTNEYFGDFLFDAYQPFKFYGDDRLKYALPSQGLVDTPKAYKNSYITYCRSLPDVNAAMVCGLDNNASIRYATLNTKSLWTNLFNMCPELKMQAKIPAAQEITQLENAMFEKMCSTDIKGAVNPLWDALEKKMQQNSQTVLTLPSEPNVLSQDDLVSEASRSSIVSESTKTLRTPTLDDPDDISTATITRMSFMENEERLIPPYAETEVVDQNADTVCMIVDGILNRLPVLFNIKSIRRKLIPSKDQKVDPLLVVLLQELTSFNVILRKIYLSLHAFKLATVGKLAMTVEMEDMSTSLVNGTLPNSWRSLVPQTQKSLSSWFNHLLKRDKQYNHWLDKTTVEPAFTWLSGLHYPRSYLTAVIQKSCRENGWELDKCALHVQVTKHMLGEMNENFGPMETSCFVYGLFLEGCGWDRKTEELCSSQPGVLMEELPVLRLLPMETQRIKTAETVELPVYVTTKRRNSVGAGLVASFNLNSRSHESHWILKGAAIILNTDD